MIQPAKGHPHGHICMYDGRNWVSDSNQMQGLYPGVSYRTQKPAYIVYRYPGADSAGVAADQASGAALSARAGGRP